MDFNYIADGIDAVVIDNFYTEDQLNDIMLELRWLTKPTIMLSQKDLMAANDNGNPLTSKSGVFLENVFKDWKHSSLISHAMTQTNSDEFRDGLLKCNTMFKALFACNIRSHLLSYYENSDYYKPHTDAFFFTILNYFHKTPKQFTGGDLIAYSCTSDKEVSIEPKHNRVVVILSSTHHEAKSIQSSFTNNFTGNGRYCNSIFLTYKDPRELKNDSN
jgi:2OG-Fe(II) oxygenase superfamily